MPYILQPLVLNRTVLESEGGFNPHQSTLILTSVKAAVEGRVCVCVCVGGGGGGGEGATVNYKRKMGKKEQKMKLEVRIIE